MENNIKEKESCFLGFKIAEQVTELMKNGSESFPLEDYPELKDWIENDQTAGRIIEKLSSSDNFSELCNKFHVNDDRQRLVNSIEKKRSKIQLINIFKVASSVAALLVLSLLFLFLDNETSQIQNPSSQEISDITVKNTITEPLKPTLILDNGDKIDLTTTQNIGNAIKKNGTNKLNYSDAKTQNITFNTLTIPKQCIYSVQLSDGSIVTLNAGSELRYPVEFKGNKRDVFLKGEAFFDIKKGEIPFIVHSENIEVKVHGTQFNINSYNKENIQTTLVEGSVCVSALVDNNSLDTMIEPNQMLTIGSKGKINLSHVDVNKYISWIDGEIISYNQPLSSLLEKVSRWYGVEFIYTKDIKDINISTSLNTDLQLSEVLDAIKKITGVSINKSKEDEYMVL